MAKIAGQDSGCTSGSVNSRPGDPAVSKTPCENSHYALRPRDLLAAVFAMAQRHDVAAALTLETLEVPTNYNLVPRKKFRESDLGQ